MGSARDFVSSSLADSLLPALRRPFEDIIYETLDHRQVPTRTDFKDLRDQLNSLRGQISGATGGIKKLSEDRDALADRLDSLEGRLAQLEARLSDHWINARLINLRAELVRDAQVAAEAASRAQVAALEARLEALIAERLAAQPVAPVVPAPPVEAPVEAPEAQAEGAASEPAAETDERCRVDGCEEIRRSKGFCAKHYQQWRRGKLPGFPLESGAPAP